MNYTVTADGNLSECRLTDNDICFKHESTTVRIKVEDIIGCEVVVPFLFFRRYGLYLWFIQKEGKQLKKAVVHITGDEDVCEKLKKDIHDGLLKIKKRPKRLLVLINPIGGNKTAVKDYKNTMEPVLKLAQIKCDVIVSERKKHMMEIVSEYDFTGIDGIVILGGDGSYLEVVNVLLRKEQKKAGVNYDDPSAKIQPITIPIGLIPTGSGNVIVGYATGLKDVLNSTLHVIKGNTCMRNAFGTYADNKLIDYAGISSAYGAFSDLVYHTDIKYRWLGRIRYYVVPIWLGLFKPFMRPFHAEVTFYTDVTETEKSLLQTDGEKEVLIENKPLKGVKTYTKDSVVIEGRFSNVMPMNGNMYNNEQKKHAWNEAFEMPGDVFSTLIYSENMTEFQLFTNLKQIINQTEEWDDSFLDSVNARGVKIIVKDDGECDNREVNVLRHLIHIDGEMYKIDKLEIQFWLHENVVPLFTSYL